MLSKFNVLLVEDDPDKRSLLQVALEMAGYSVWAHLQHLADQGRARGEGLKGTWSAV